MNLKHPETRKKIQYYYAADFINLFSYKNCIKIYRNTIINNELGLYGLKDIKLYFQT
jgi:hypothetical protein